MSPTASVLILLIVNKIDFGEHTLISAYWKLTSRRFIEVETEKSLEEASDTAKFPKEIVLAVVLGLVFLMAIALMENEANKHDADPCLPRFKVSNKENYSGQSGLRLKKGFLKKKTVQKKPELLSKLDLSKPAEPVDVGNVSQVYKLFDSNSSPTSIFKPYESLFKDRKEGDLALSTVKHCYNEVTAYRFDQLTHTGQRAGVPETRHVKLPAKVLSPAGTGTVRGSLQKFQLNSESCEDYGPSLFAVQDVHNIGLLDLKILNCDRHAGNILFDSTRKALTPIDHALSFPEIELSTPDSEGAILSRDLSESTLFLKNISFDWLLFPQAKQPFTQETLNAIKDIDMEEHMKVMTKMGMNMRQKLAVFSGLTLLKEASLNQNKTLYEIGCLVQRQRTRKTLSTLEELVNQTLTQCDVHKLEKQDQQEAQRYCKKFKEELLNYFKV